MVEIDPDLWIYKISRIQVDADPHTILDFKNPEANIAGISVEKTHYPKGMRKIVALCRRHVLSLFCKKQRPLNRAKNFLEREVNLITHILNFIIQFNQSVTKESPSFPTVTFKNFDCYWYDKRFLSYWYSSRFDVAGLDNHACISHLKALQMGVKKYKKLPLTQVLRAAQRDLKKWKEALKTFWMHLSDTESRYLVMKLSEKLGKTTSNSRFVRQQFVYEWARNGQCNFIQETASCFIQCVRKNAVSQECLSHLYKKIYRRQKMLVELLQKDNEFAPFDLIALLHQIPDFKQSFEETLRSLKGIQRDPMAQKETKEKAQEEQRLVEKFQ